MDIPGVSESYVTGVRTPAKLPLVFFRFVKNECLDCYRTDARHRLMTNCARIARSERLWKVMVHFEEALD